MVLKLFITCFKSYYYLSTESIYIKKKTSVDFFYCDSEQVFEKSPKKKAKTIEERYSLNSFQEESKSIYFMLYN